MFAGELQRQKTLFAVCDGAALLVVFAVSLKLHDPAGAMEVRFFGDNPALLWLDMLAVVCLWILVFRVCDLYQIRNDSLRKFVGIAFRQTRIGMRARPFKMLKLRIMPSTADDSYHRDYLRQRVGEGESAAQNSSGGERVFKLANDKRFTRTGRWLHRFSVDELPQLINVIRREMSLIGPRAALPYELELYEPWHLRRLEAAPGKIGLWQVSGRNHLSFDEMVRLDVQYVQSWSFVGDLRILLRTLPALVRGAGM